VGARWEQDLVAPGLWTSPEVHTALVIGSIVAVVSAVTGFFVVLRGQAFLGHALSDMGASGAAGAALLGVQALWGYLAGGIVAGALTEATAGDSQSRDVATGIVLAAMLGLGSLFLALVTATTSDSGVTETVLFGSIFTVAPGIIPAMGALAAGALVLMAVLYRPLLFSSVLPDTAMARGVPVAVVNGLFLVAVVTAVEQTSVLVGALLSTALLIGPAAIAVRLSRRPGLSMALAVLIGAAATWLGIILSYDSYLWPPRGAGWPVSFFITTLILLGYLATYVGPRRGRAAGSPEALPREARP
jgi:zinc/manganese transport system permease protein